ncbi:hypothetical protein K469DRAFT_787057 [Zopfia rhizophila CBS 207.26]|uniref:Zn(2)-C6 fungal-type domain-containing protein n=1 Tax=Zopfia rhizophila CBS 207.26 TaxID=1314779 RepID=A0A6A6DZ76_9PEZI|nr:hypothetical protein K469DRAFT_787057 [Zopfia rhizophila CBS 207.26]
MSLRRPHKKSRLGCQECKRRHVKCDEARPTCANCLAAPRTCVYQPSPSRTVRSPSVPSTRLPLPVVANSTTFATTAPSPTSVRPTPQVSTPSTFAASVASPSLTATPPAQYRALCPPLNMRHMELFSHFIFDTGPSLDEGGSLDREYLRIIMPAALSVPYVMHQILALSALHLSHTRAAQAKYYREEATALQTQALSLFNDALTEITAGNCVPTLIFASFLGLHAFVTYLNLHRGVRAVTERSWKLLMQSNISSILNGAERSLGATSSQLQERATIVADHMHSLLDHADMGTDSRMACRVTVSRLQLIYQSESSAGEIPREEHLSAGLIWAWPILLSGVFTDLLMKRRPEALIILCHYAVLLHQRRRMWLVGNAGRMLIEAITKFLGTYWKHWLDWPNQMLEELS